MKRAVSHRETGIEPKMYVLSEGWDLTDMFVLFSWELKKDYLMAIASYRLKY